MNVNTDELAWIAEREFPDLVADVFIPDDNQLRISLWEGSFVDVWFSLDVPGRYAYHWERRAIAGTIYRHDNAPHVRWMHIPTYPAHFHDGSETNVVESWINPEPQAGLRQMLSFIRERLREEDR